MNILKNNYRSNWNAYAPIIICVWFFCVFDFGFSGSNCFRMEMSLSVYLVSLILVVKQHRSGVSSGLDLLRRIHLMVYVP